MNASRDVNCFEATGDDDDDVVTGGDDDIDGDDGDGGGTAGDDDVTNVVDTLIPFEDEVSITHSASSNQCQTPSATITIRALDADETPLSGVPIKIGSLPPHLQVNQSIITTDSFGEADFIINFNCNGFSGSIPVTIITTITFTDNEGQQVTTDVMFTTRVVP